MSANTTLIIPDAHVKPHQSLRRFRALSNYIAAKQPGKIKCLGDWADMPSLCSYDKGTRGFEGKRYEADVYTSQQAMDILFSAINDYNRRHKKTPYLPQLDFILGNHERRINRATEKEAWLTGTIELDDLQLRSYGWEVHDFLTPHVDDGIVYIHYVPSGPMDTPMSGDNLANNLIKKLHKSVVVGHLHSYQTAQGFRADGQRMRALVAGCFTEDKEDYMSFYSQLRWWRGISMLHDVSDGDYNLEEVSLNALLKEYL